MPCIRRFRRGAAREARAPRCAGRAAPLAALLALAALPEAAHARGAQPPDDAFLAGYARAVLERELGAEATIRVHDGVVRLAGEDVDPELVQRLREALAGVEGVRGVELAEPHPPPPAPGARTAARGPPARAGVEILPEAELFDPLLADPRWPHFGAAWQRYTGERELRNVAATSFGETIPLLAAPAPGDAGRLELALHAGVFSIFDLDASSFDLVNSDFLAGLALGWRRGDLSAMLRVLHQSSHLGDEFLLRNRVERINLSFEEVDLLVSWDAQPWLRLYGGGGWLLRTDPDDLEHGSFQLGVELESPRAFWRGHLRPVGALDLQTRQESDWNLDLSARVGLQLESPRLWSQRVQLLLEFYDGRSPNGQFFERDITYFGVGTHVHF